MSVLAARSRRKIAPLRKKKRGGSEKDELCRGYFLLPNTKSQHPHARNDYDEEAAFVSYMNPEPGFQSGPGDSANAD